MPEGAFYGQEGAFWDQEGAALRARQRVTEGSVREGDVPAPQDPPPQ